MKDSLMYKMSYYRYVQSVWHYLLDTNESIV